MVRKNNSVNNLRLEPGTIPTPKVEYIISQIDAIPTIPSVAAKILKANEEQAIRDLIAIIAQDQSISARILKVANSPFYGFVRKVTSIEHAVILLGLKELRNIVLMVTLYNFVETMDGGFRFNRKAFWQHTLYCGMLAEAMGSVLDSNQKDYCFLAGLLHDIGRVVIDKYFFPQFKEILARVSQRGETLIEAENEVLGLTHERIGKLLLGSWDIPFPICSAVLYHHQPWNDLAYTQLSTLIYLSNIFCSSNGFPSYTEDNLMPWEEFIQSEEAALAMEALPNVSLAEISKELFRNLKRCKDLSPF